jgi:hypothetical protein
MRYMSSEVTGLMTEFSFHEPTGSAGPPPMLSSFFDKREAATVDSRRS